MPRHYACDHCGRVGVVMGVYYPGRDMTQPAVRLCQTYNGEPVSPNCYHLVVEMGEELGLRKGTPILATDRHSPKVEGAQIRFDQHVTAGTIVTERHPDVPAPLTGVPVTGEGEVTQQAHPLTGQSIPSVPDDAVIDPAVTEAEKSKGIINPDSANQKPLIDPASPEGQALADAAAQEEARKIAAPVGMSPRSNPDGQTVDFPTPPSEQFIDPSDTIAGQAAVLDAERHDTDLPRTPAAETQADKPKTPAEIAKAAQERADAEEAERKAKERMDRNPETKARVEEAAANEDKAVEVELPPEVHTVTPEEAAEIEKSAKDSGLTVAPAKKAAAKKAPAKKAAPKAAE